MRIILLTSMVAAALLSCSRYAPEEITRFADGAEREPGTGALTLALSDGLSETVDSSSHPGWESAVVGLDVVLFRSDGTIFRHCRFCGTASDSVTVRNLREGTYRIAVLANTSASLNFNALHDIDELYDRKPLLLSYNIRDTGLVMLTPRGFADRTWTVSEDQTTSVGAVLERPVSRVTLSSITNVAPVAVTVESVMLTNVADSIRTDGTVLSWINRQGRADESPREEDHIIGTGTHRASCEDLTFCRIGKDIPSRDTCGTAYCLYGNANTSTGEPAGFTPAFPPSGEKTCLVVTAVMDGRRCYYPLVLDSLKAGESYDCALRIIGKGSDDPNVPVKTGESTFTVTMKSWNAYYSYHENI